MDGLTPSVDLPKKRNPHFSVEHQTFGVCSVDDTCTNWPFKCYVTLFSGNSTHSHTLLRYATLEWPQTGVKANVSARNYGGPVAPVYQDLKFLWDHQVFLCSGLLENFWHNHFKIEVQFDQHSDVIIFIVIFFSKRHVGLVQEQVQEQVNSVGVWTSRNLAGPPDFKGSRSIDRLPRNEKFKPRPC